MSFFTPSLKTIYKSVTSAVVSISMASITLMTSSALAFNWPWASSEEVQKKLSRSDFSASTSYYARGPTFLRGQIWDLAAFEAQARTQNYRLREVDQALLEGDAKKLDATQCKEALEGQNSELILETDHCWQWKNHFQESYLVVIDERFEIKETFRGEPFKVFWKASLDPILVAQYRGNEPIMQIEHKISDYPAECLRAVMAIEDNDFLDHSGVSYTGIARAFVKNLIKMRAAQGGSTITQQLVKNYFLTPEKTLERKFKELILATKVESQWTKDEILETYLNIIYMGQSGAFQVRGFGAASKYYFNKSVPQLELQECALLAAIINNPALNNPWKKPEKAQQRRQLVLSKMKELKLISENEFNLANNKPLPVKNELKAQETAPYFFEAVREQLKKMEVSLDGVRIETSLDLEAQEKAQKSLQSHIAELESQRKNLKENKEKGFKLEGLVVASDNQTGLVTVLVGGQNFRLTQFNRALAGHRQIGSLIKPFVYYTALEFGWEDHKDLTPLSTIMDEKFVWKYENKTWSPTNYEKKFNGEVPIYHALKESLNSPAAQIAYKVGLDKLVQVAQSAGFSSSMDLTPSLSLGASQHYALEVLTSYRTLALMGVRSENSFIEKIKDREGNTVFEFESLYQEALNPTTTAVLVGMMKETLRTGTARAATTLNWFAPAAGKTGTTSDNKDAWFAGFTPYQTTVVWLGYDQSLSSKLTGSSGAVPIWIRLMKDAQKRWPEKDFQWPDTVEYKEVPLFGDPNNKNTQLIFRK